MIRLSTHTNAQTSSKVFRFIAVVQLIILLGLLPGCGKKEETNSDQLFKISFQTDWYPQAEHGGFYQALIEGYYAAEGLEVEILPGGPNTGSKELVALGKVQFAIGKSHDVLIQASKGVPFVMAGALLQHDPQALLFHKENPIHGFKDLDGKRIMAGTGTAFVELLRRKYQIEFELLPLDYGLGQFLRDKTFIQQCFITSEPYYARIQGANPGALLIKESGFDPYHVWYARTDFALKYPEIVEKFSRASIKGWQEYLFGDRSKADALLASLNPKLDEEFIAYSVGALIEHNLVTGSTGQPTAIGQIDPERIAAEIKQLNELGFMDGLVEVNSVLTESHFRK
jgi:NitT/TauT family transport system substrate-binding protein